MTAPVTDFELSSGEKQSPLWLRLKQHIGERIASAHTRLEHIALDERETAALRGEIRAFRALASLDEDRPIVTGE